MEQESSRPGALRLQRGPAPRAPALDGARRASFKGRALSVAASRASWWGRAFGRAFCWFVAESKPIDGLP